MNIIVLNLLKNPSDDPFILCPIYLLLIAIINFEQLTTPAEAQSSKTEFDNLHINSNVFEQLLPVLLKEPQPIELIKTVKKMQQHTEKPLKNNGRPSAKNNRKAFDSKTEIITTDDFDKKHHHHHHRHHHRHGHSSHHHRHGHSSHHHRHGSHHRHDSHHQHHHHHRPHHHHHRHRRYSYSPYSEYSDYSHDFHRDYHHNQSVKLPRIITPRPLKIITPTPSKINTSIYRDIGINTGNETKIMRDSSVTVDFVDVPNIADKRLEQIPVVRRTIIVEPYPAQPSSQIIVKPRTDMIGKVRLGKNIKLNGNDETIVYPSTSFTTKKIKKKKTNMINNNIIDDLHLDDISDDDDDDDKKKNGSSKTKIFKNITRQKIKNAFYN
ncbi:unnamed protein product [Rotaria sordida]|uniref:Uncharacterized protein n=2 Tax=Rotaria sordida TaxID=392033 RepID=A0A815A8N0_9BILA|nr:unnamed protein product [Rotaria sordida]CAF3725397.1 unnamed protein product [Rotaria sordida]